MCTLHRRFPAVPDAAGLRWTVCASLALGTTAWVGCRGNRIQSMLHPAGPGAESIAWLWWVLLAICTAVFILVMGLLWRGIVPGPFPPPPQPPAGDTGFIVLGGILLPAVVSIGLLIASLRVTQTLQTPAEGLTIRVVGHQWWWEVEYLEEGIVTANELYIPVGRPVLLQLEAADVIHSFWVPNLMGKRDMIPGHISRFWIQADKAGEYRGHCAEFCGVQHAGMGLMVVAQGEDDFQAWIERMQRPTPEPDTPELELGKAVFVRDCQTCHAVADSPAEGVIGPDLTHIGSRLTLGAALVPNNRGNLTGWVADAQRIKPGNRMPPSNLTSEELHAVVRYMETLQ